METAKVNQTKMLSDILNTYIITHFRKHEIEGVEWYAIGIVRKEIWLAGENGIDYLPQVYEDTNIDNLYEQILNAADCT